MAEWVKVARLSELTNKEMKAFRRIGVHVAVVLVDGEVFAFEDYCSHSYCSFTPGAVEDNDEVLCLCHYAKFNYRTGEVIWGPAYKPIKVYPVRVEGDIVLVEIEEPSW